MIVMTAKARTARTARTATATPKAPVQADPTDPTTDPTTTPDVQAPVQAEPTETVPAETAPESDSPVQAETANPTETVQVETVQPVNPLHLIKIDAITLNVTDLAGIATAYGAANTGTKTKIRNAMQAGMMAAVMASDIDTAKLFGTVQDAIKNLSAAKAETDNTAVLADRIIALRYAAHILEFGDILPDGMDKSTVNRDRLAELIKAHNDQGDNDAVTTDQATMGRSLATTKLTRSAARGSIEAHLETAFQGVAVGTVLTVAQVRTRSGAASDGAIAARLWPTNGKGTTVDLHAMGIELATTDSGTRAIRKVRDSAATPATPDQAPVADPTDTTDPTDNA
jgi:hypothetical protein